MKTSVGTAKSKLVDTTIIISVLMFLASATVTMTNSYCALVQFEPLLDSYEELCSSF